MKLIPEAKKGHKFWSVRLGTLAAIATGAEFIHQQILPLWGGVVPDGALAAIGALLITGSVVSRFIIQKRLSDD